jgi:catalase
MKMQGDAIHFINEAFKHCKPLGAIDEGIEIFKAANLPDIKFAGNKSKNGKVVSDKGVVTASLEGMEAFNESFIEAIAKHRHWDREKKEQVPA